MPPSFNLGQHFLKNQLKEQLALEVTDQVFHAAFSHEGGLSGPESDIKEQELSANKTEPKEDEKVVGNSEIKIIPKSR